MITTPGQIMLNEALPEEFRKDSHDFNGKYMTALLTEIAKKYPDQYRDIAQRLMQFGHFASIAGGASLSLSSLIPPAEIRTELDKLRARVYEIGSNDDLPQEQKEKSIIKLVASATPTLKDAIFKAGIAQGNAFAQQAQSGSRGNANQLMQLMLGDGLVADHRDRIIPIPILHGYAHGLDPAEYFAGSYGARRGSVCLQEDTQIRMADGTVKSIKEIKVGDVIIGSDLNGVLRPTRVLNVFDQGIQPCYRYTFRKNSTEEMLSLEATETHRMLARLKGHGDCYSSSTAISNPTAIPLGQGKVYSRRFTRNTYVACLGNGTQDHTAKMVNKEFIGDKQTYDIEVDHPDHLFVLANGLISHNSSKFCLHEDTCIACVDRTYTAIKDIKPGREIWAVDENGKHVLTRVVRVYNTGKRFCTQYKLVAKNRKSPILITCTPEHKIWMQSAEDSVMVPIGYANSSSTIYWLKFNHQKRVDLTKYTPTLETCTYGGSNAIGYAQTYDLEIEHPSHRFLLSTGLVVSNSTQESGFLGKQLAQATHRLVVTMDDCGTSAGIPVPANDSDYIGSVLAQDGDGFKAGSILDPKLSKGLGDKQIYVRSPITCQAPEGVCAKCVGIREKGKLPEIGENVGMPAAHAISEKVSQGALSEKHSGGAVGNSARSAAGFDYLNQLIQVPDNFAGEAPVSEVDGIVTAIEPAPQGGSYIRIGENKYYTQPDQNVTVKVGERVEAGDALSDGTPNPFKVTMHKGIGEGRRYLASVLAKGLTNTGVSAHKRNVEMVARGLVNHVQITNPDGFEGFLPDDIVSFDDIKSRYQPREGFQELEPHRATNMYLERPVLQYSIGTRVTPRIINDLKTRSIGKIAVHKDKPPFEPYVVRAMESAMRDRNWMTRMYGSFLGKGFQDAVARGAESDIHDTSFIPSLAQAKDFGKDLTRTGKY